MIINNKEWQSFFLKEIEKDYFPKIKSHIEKEKESGPIIYPPSEEIFNMYEILSPKDIKVVIIGQDPYHGKGQAHGLAFSVKDDIKIPPSLRNMYKELSETVQGFEIPKSGNLNEWAKQGVFLLNNVLTVEEKKPDSHKGIGWEYFTNSTIDYINESCEGVVFVLWGGNARKKAKSIDNKKHLILESAHPSPLSAYRGFFGCNHFNLINEYLTSINKEKIDWNI